MNALLRNLCFCLALSMAPALAQTPAEKLSAEGLAALKENRLAEAETIFRQLLGQRGRSAFAHHNLGIVFERRGDHAAAGAQFREALRLEPANGPSHLLLGVSLLALGKTAEATRSLKQAVKLMPKEPQARLQLGRAYETAEDLPAAVEQYFALAELDARDPEYAYQLGRALGRLSEWSYRRMIAINPDSARLHQSLAQQYLGQGKFDLAIAEYNRAAESDPKLPEIHLGLAVIYFEQKRYADAAREIDLELKLSPESRKALDLKQKIEAARAGSQ
jgi:Flp pilus assembly protein TadD